MKRISISISVIILTVFTASSTMYAKGAAPPEGRAGKPRQPELLHVNERITEIQSCDDMGARAFLRNKEWQLL